MNQFKDKILKEFESKLYRYLNMSLSEFLGVFRKHGEDPMVEFDKVLEEDGPDELRLLMDVYINGLSILYLETELGRNMTTAEMEANADRLGLRVRMADYKAEPFRVPKRIQNGESYSLCFKDFSIEDLKGKTSEKSILMICCGECEEQSEVSMEKVLATKSLDHWQVHSFFKEWICPECKTPTDYRRYYLDDEMIIEAELVIDEGSLNQL